MQKLEPYNEEIEEQMKNLYQSLSEKDQRRYAAIEAKKLGYGGIRYICRVFACDPSSVTRGLRELGMPLTPRARRIREAGGGRKPMLEIMPKLDDAFLDIMTPHTAGSPMDETVKWSNLSRAKIAEELASKGFAVSVTVVDQLLAKHDFRHRQAFKREAGQPVAQRDEQFKNIERLVEAARTTGNPVMSMDVKKKS
jgi:hypothetical protein